MGTLNRSRPYGTVCGTGVDHTYEQDGKCFDGMGREVFTEVLPDGPLPEDESSPLFDQAEASRDDEVNDEAGENEALDATPDASESKTKRPVGRPRNKTGIKLKGDMSWPAHLR